MKRVIMLVLLAATTLPIAGCIVAPYPGYYHYGPRCWHPYRCY